MRFQLRDFEGPLDLLLFLVGENELDIWDIPIVTITRQYQRWMDEIGEVDLDAAGDYILMSATLLQIKARLLLPREEGEAPQEDPRRELALRLLDYQRLRQLSHALGELESEGRLHWRRTGSDLEGVEPGTRDESLREVSLYDLARAYAELVARPAKSRQHEIELFPVTVEEQALLIREQVARRAILPLSGLQKEKMERPLTVVSLLAVLDLMRLRQIAARQTHAAGEVWIFDPERRTEWLRDLRDLA
jgi:segregation and condensation protein A